MPIVEPSSFQALDLVPFQINPHYTEERIPHHGGETRVERLLEFVAANHDMPVIALPESSMLEVRDSAVKLVGSQAATVFRSGQEPSGVGPGPVDLA
jgi:dipeptidase E